jgi:hypothetical protein
MERRRFISGLFPAVGLAGESAAREIRPVDFARGFRHGRDQFVSAAATSWATMEPIGTLR